MDIFLHIGAHKTATTHLQKTLARNKNSLAEAGILYIDLESTRKFLTEPFFGTRQDSDKAIEFAKKIVEITRQNYDICLISDENIIGEPRHIYNSLYLYPHSAQRIGAFHQLFEHTELNILLSIRSLSNFLPSLYCEALRWDPYHPFDDVFSRSFEGLSWATMVNNIYKNNSPKKITVWQYETYTSKIFEEIFKDRGLQLPHCINERVRPSLSADAIHLYASLHNHIKEGAWMNVINKLNNTAWPEKRYQPLNSDEIDYLEQLYKLDLQQLKLLKDVTVI